jgi:hypothetical protein
MLPAIMEWLILLLLVPAIVVPLVLRFGFAGCSFEAPPVPPPPPVITSVTATDLRTLTVRWSDTSGTGTEFIIERTKVADPASPLISKHVDISARELIDDGDLEEGTEYRYTVQRGGEDPPAGVSGGSSRRGHRAAGLYPCSENRAGEAASPPGVTRVAITIRSARLLPMKIAKIYIPPFQIP